MAQPEQGRNGASQLNKAAVTEGERQSLQPKKGRPTWTDIKGWHNEGLGRVIGAADFYALRYSTGNFDWRNDRVLLVFPETNDLCLVGPRASIAESIREREAENEGYRSDFAAIFSHTSKPYRHPSWEPAVGESTYASFLNNAPAFSVDIHKMMFLEEEREAEIQRALDHERHLRERARVRTLGSRDALVGALGSEDATFLAGLDGELATELERIEHDRRLRKAGADQAAPDDIVTLYEDLHHLERGEDI